MELVYRAKYAEYGIGDDAQRLLALLGDMILSAGLNVTGVKDPEEVEKVHFLDSLALLDLPVVQAAAEIADVGSGGGLPAIVLALALPGSRVTAIESVTKKCRHIIHVAAVLGLENVRVFCERAEDHGQSEGREAYDVVTSRAVASLPVVAEYSLPLLKVGGSMVAMKGQISDQERTRALRALGILGSDGMEEVRLTPFSEARDRLVFLVKKSRPTPGVYPRRAGVPQKRPLG